MGIDWEYYLDAEGEDMADAYDDLIGDAMQYFEDEDDYYEEEYEDEDYNSYDDSELPFGDDNCESQPDNTASSENPSDTDCLNNNVNQPDNIDKYCDLILSDNEFLEKLLDRLIDKLEDRLIDRLSEGFINKIKSKPENNPHNNASDEIYYECIDESELPF